MIAVLICLLLSIAVNAQYVGPDWQKLSSVQKAGALYKVVVEDQTSMSWPNALQLGELFVESMNRSFDYIADQMPHQGILDLELRRKLVHSVGAVAFGKFVVTASDNNYTGIFRSGANETFIRFSLAANPSSNAVTPGVAFKFLRSGVPSSSAFGMYRLSGQPEANFFQHDLTNHVPDLSPEDALALRLLKRRFSTASAYANMLGLSDAATYDRDGRRASNPVFPFRIIFHPTSELHYKMTNFKFPSSFSTIQPSIIYWVYVQDTPWGAPRKFGYFETLSSITTSFFGDKHLFFEHFRQEVDFSYRPEWQAPADAINKYQSEHKGYAFPDLPFN